MLPSELAQLRLLLPEEFSVEARGRGLGLTLRNVESGRPLLTLEMEPQPRGGAWPEGLARLLEDLGGSLAAAHRGLAGSTDSPEDRILKLAVEAVERALARHEASARLRVRTKVHTARPEDWF